MSAPLYFLPGIHRQQLLAGHALSAALLEARGLLAIFGDVVNLQQEVSLMDLPGVGPGETSGTMLVPLVPGREPPTRLGFFPAMQDWQEVGGKYWLGIDRESRPAPEDLVRHRRIGGYSMKLGDGQEWNIPILRRPDGSSEFPTGYTREADGSLRATVRSGYHALWEESAEIVEWFLSGNLWEIARTEMGRVLDWCVRILSVNYRFDWALQNRLVLFGSDEWASVLMYAIDWPLYVELNPQKKTSDTSASGAESPPSAAPASSSPGPAEGTSAAA